jgi:tRNA(Ile)-lysidine synthase
VQDMLSNDDSGRIFYSNTHQILQNRDELILSAIANNEPTAAIIIESIQQNIETPVSLKMQLLDLNSVNYKSAQFNEIYVDAAKIQFPLTLRKWQTGDQMQPLGMKHQKKISDILIDNKIDNLTKANSYVLCNASNEIIWLINQRVSENFKIEANSKNVLHISLN